MIVLALAVVLLATPIVGTVIAGKGQEKLSFQIVYEGDLAPAMLTFDLIPKKYVFPADLPEASRFVTAWTFANPTATLWVDGEPYVPDDFDYVGVNIGFLDLDPEPPNQPPSFVVSKTTATFTFDGIGTIVFEETGKMFNLMTPDAYIWLRGIGWGTGQLEGVKIDAHRSGECTVMGWPTELFP